jgi:cytochrome c-type biogenesis protein CcmH
MSPNVVFYIAGAVLLAGVLFVLLRPLWNESRKAVAGLAMALGLAAVALYGIVGTPAALDMQQAAMPQTLDDAITQLQAQLAKDPNQPEGWRLLGQALGTEQRYAEARDAYAHAAKLSPRDADVLVEAAQSRALATPQHRFDAQGVALLQQALQVQPQHQRARWFLGIAQRQAGDDAAAAKTWEPLLAMVDGSTANSLRAQIDEARKSAGLPPLPKTETVAAAPSQSGLRVRVALDPALAERARLRGDATVFVIARAAGGPPMPVAVERHSLQDLPLDIVLDDGDSPMPTQKLSALQDVEVLARISPSGDAIPKAGDLESAPVKVTLPAAGPVDVSIGAVRP